MTLWRGFCIAAFALVGIPMAVPANAASPVEVADARDLFIDQCARCHRAGEAETAMSPEMLLVPVVALPNGPPITRIFGQPAGQTADYPYSRAFVQKAPEIVWDAETLDVWLTATQKLIPGTSMFYRQDDAEIRATIIAYLRTMAESAAE